MRESQQAILGLGMMAALVQLTLWAPHRVVAYHDFVSQSRVEVTRRYPVWMEPARISTTDGERADGAPFTFLPDAHALDRETLGIQLGVTALLTGLLYLSRAKTE